MPSIMQYSSFRYIYVLSYVYQYKVDEVLKIRFSKDRFLLYCFKKAFYFLLILINLQNNFFFS